LGGASITMRCQAIRGSWRWRATTPPIECVTALIGRPAALPAIASARSAAISASEARRDG
jgi:hypothetical protein